MTTEDELNDFLSRINPKIAALYKRASDIETKTLPLPSLGLNLATGGLGYAKIHTLWGNRSSGKTLTCLGLAREAQARGEIVAWVDAEKNFDPAWAIRHGVDPSTILLSRATRMSTVADSAVELVKAGADLLIVDSMSVLLPQSFFVKDSEELKGLADSGQIGTFAKNYASMVSMINDVNEKTCVVMISQVRNKISTYGAAKSLMGGESAEHINSTIIKFWASPNSRDDIHAKVDAGGYLIEKPVGRPITWTIDKARGPGLHMSNSYDLYFAGPAVGIDLTSEVITFGVEYGVIKKSGNWLSYGDMDKGLNGKPAFSKYLKENPEVQSMIYKEVLERAADE